MLTVLLAAVVLTRPAIVERVKDGDTIVVRGHGVVRLLGVDTPESVHPRKPVEPCGKEASDYTRGVLAGRKVTLEWERGGKPSRDRYGRALAYVRLATDVQDSHTFNEHLIEQGYSVAYTRFPFRRREEFIRAELLAQMLARGIWGRPPCGAKR